MSELRHKCRFDGCWNEKYRIGWQHLDDCLAGRNEFTDLDAPMPGWAERYGFFFVVEHKTPGTPIRKGQIISFLQFTRLQRGDGVHGNLVVAFEGHAPTMSVDRFKTFWEGREYDWEDGPLDRLKTRIKRWELRSCRQPQLARLNREVLPVAALPPELRDPAPAPMTIEEARNAGVLADWVMGKIPVRAEDVSF